MVEFRERLRWEAKPNLGLVRDKKPVPLEMEIAFNPLYNGRIIINYPGYRGDIDGYENKHKKLAAYMQENGLGAVLRGKGPGFPDFNGFTDDTQLRKMIEYALSRSVSLCGEKNPELLLIGTSAGGGAVATVAAAYNASRILLMAPATNIGEKQITESFKKYAGEVYIVVGENDDVVGGILAGQYFLDRAASASHKELFMIPNCGHRFKGEINGRIMSEAPFYAFSKGEKPKFPDPEGGIILYQ